ncbi:MAG: DUF1684 domain-containing protein [Bacteroidota bacterium]|nr:DUF1684 domain-containing protein [Bacteroidota bacterium]
MNRIGILLFTLFLLLNCDNRKRYNNDLTPFQREINDFFKDASVSPLKKRDLKNFRGLDFFTYDSTYLVTAKLTKTPKEKPFMMLTTTDMVVEYIKYGTVSFELLNNQYSLDIYKNLEDPNERDNLFLPFLDDTNGNESYGGGRYINLSIPQVDNLIIDFNSAFNPYCVYDEKYSCPIVPAENYLPLEIKAGVMNFLN